MGRFRFLVTGGGTGGHIYPALSIAEGIRLRRPDALAKYVGVRGGAEERLARAAGLPFEGIPAAGVVGKNLVVAAGSAGTLLRGYLAALRVVRSARPHVVVGTGGYVAAPVMAAAATLRVPYVIQEQNAVPGQANLRFARGARAVALGFEEAAPQFRGVRRVVVTGNPVRPAILEVDRETARSALGIPEAAVHVLIFMGSRGSSTIGAVVADALPRLAGTSWCHITFATGEMYHEGIVRRLAAGGITNSHPGNLRVVPYIDDMPVTLAAADLVVCRAGAVTLAELAARGVASLLVPSPHVTHHHQERNAAVFERAGAAEVVHEAGLEAEGLVDHILRLCGDRAGLRRMGAAAGRLGRPHALDDIVDLVLEAAAD